MFELIWTYDFLNLLGIPLVILILFFDPFLWFSLKNEYVKKKAVIK